MSLYQENGFKELVEHFEENKEKPWKDWLDTIQLFPRPGKQGVVGLVSSKQDPSKTYVFKFSQYLNYLIHQEMTVMKSLTPIANYCPHFCRLIGSLYTDIDPTKTGSNNPFQIDCKYPVEKEILLMEQIKKGYKFFNYLSSDKSNEDSIYSLVKQTLIAVSIAQKKKRFTHYDLHSNNVMVRKCSKNLVFLYILDDNTQFCVPSHGHYATIIDFGFSYSSDLDNGYMWPTLNHTDVGFFSDRYDRLSDPKLFLVTVADEIYQAKKSKTSKKLRNISKNLFSKLKLDWGSGWDKGIRKCASDYVFDRLEKIKTVSTIFQEHQYSCLDIIQSLIILPLHKQKTESLELSYKTFTAEFVKIENEIGSPFYSLYVLKGIVDSAREVSSDYATKAYRQQALDFFRSSLYERLDSIASFCFPKEVHFEKMLCSLLCLVKAIEGVLHKAMTERCLQKSQDYAKLPIQSVDEIVTMLNVNIPDPYVFTENSSLMVIDARKEDCWMLSLTEEQARKVNEYDSMYHGTELYKILNLSSQ